MICSASSVDDEGSPKDAYGFEVVGNEDDDNSILWSAATGGGNYLFYIKLKLKSTKVILV